MLFAKLRSEYDSYSKTEKKIADIILSTPEEFINMSALKLSKLADVSQGSINNFSKKLVGGGFSELKMAVAKGVNLYKKNFFNIVSDSDSITDVLETSTQKLISAIVETQKLNSEETLKEAVDMIVEAKNIEIWGAGQSGFIAQDFRNQLLKLGIRAVAVYESLAYILSAASIPSDTLVIIISSSGKTKAVYDALRIAREKGVRALAITRNKLAPIPQNCDLSLIVSPGNEALSRFETTTRLSEHYLIDALCSYIRYKKDKDGQRYFDLTEMYDNVYTED